MRTEKVHSLILGAGPAGLAAGYTLAKAGLAPLVLEKDKVVGGLMRSIKRGDFVVDIGRKELYNRLEKVDVFWGQILGDEYRPYPHRGGLLYDGHIIDLSPAYRGVRRGMPWGLFAGCCTDFLKARLTRGPVPKNVEEYFYQQRGRRLTQVVSQGFQEKLTGRQWSEIPIAPDQPDSRESFFETLRGALTRAFSVKEPNTYKNSWRHPAKGTGQIIEFLERGILEEGGRVACGVKLVGMSASADKVTSVTAEVDNEQIIYEPSYVISSIPVEILVQYLKIQRTEDGNGADKGSPFRKKTVILVYLFLDEPPRFPHAWLNVTCPNTRIGRITNYVGLSGDMVPEGKTCLCCEFYAFGEDPILEMSNEQFAELALKECARCKLLDPEKCFDNLVLRLPGADPSQNRHNWLSKIRLGLLDQLKPFTNLYYVNRTDLDIATLAGIDAAEAVISGDRERFDRNIDPRELGIRSESKAFEFKSPVEL